jgi:hypothetical protein
LLRRNARASRGHDDIDLQSRKFSRNLTEAFVASFRPAIFDRDGPAFDPAKFA